MKVPRVYIDTSVIGGCFDEEFEEESTKLIEMARDGEIVLVVSQLLMEEIVDAPEDVRALIPDLADQAVEFCRASEETVRLHKAYLAEGVVGPSAADDARHVANATVAHADVIVSWNLKDIVHYDKIRGYNGVNIREGYTLMVIHTPKEVV